MRMILLQLQASGSCSASSAPGWLEEATAGAHPVARVGRVQLLCSCSTCSRGGASRSFLDGGH